MKPLQIALLRRSIKRHKDSIDVLSMRYGVCPASIYESASDNMVKRFHKNLYSRSIESAHYQQQANRCI
jgi:hypothetical protein